MHPAVGADPDRPRRPGRAASAQGSWLGEPPRESPFRTAKSTPPAGDSAPGPLRTAGAGCCSGVRPPVRRMRPARPAVLPLSVATQPTHGLRSSTAGSNRSLVSPRPRVSSRFSARRYSTVTSRSSGTNRQFIPDLQSDRVTSGGGLGARLGSERGSASRSSGSRSTCCLATAARGPASASRWLGAAGDA